MFLSSSPPLLRTFIMTIGQDPQLRGAGEDSDEESPGHVEQTGKALGDLGDTPCRTTDIDSQESAPSCSNGDRSHPDWMNDYLAEPCIFGLKEKIERTKREIAEAKRLEFELGDEFVEIVDDDDFPVPTWNPEEWPDAQPRGEECLLSPVSPQPTHPEPEHPKECKFDQEIPDRHHEIARIKARIAELKAAQLSAPLFGSKLKHLLVYRV